MPTTRLLIASNNVHKVVEFRRLFEGLPYEIVTPADLGLDLDPEETGDTFVENARLKARAFAEASGLPAMADDSGIVVDALNGEPGVRSARYGGPGLDDQGRVQLLLANMEGVPDERRACRFKVTLVLVGFDDEDLEVEGVCEGRVAYAPAGPNGFGYDPVFFVEAHGKTMAELSDAQKDEISHRGRAGRAMAALLAAR